MLDPAKPPSPANWRDGDAFYAALMTAMAGLSDAEAFDLMTRLTLLLANEVGDADKLAAALAAAHTGAG
jgi:hypothetical protein